VALGDQGSSALDVAARSRGTSPLMGLDLLRGAIAGKASGRLGPASWRWPRSRLIRP